jgi:hypothetical protein
MGQMPFNPSDERGVDDRAYPRAGTFSLVRM